MGDEKTRDQNQGNEQPRGQAMGATAGAQAQGPQPDRQNPGNNPKQSEFAGQGGGIQGSGQRQENPGGYTDSKGGPGAQNARPNENQANNHPAQQEQQEQ